MPSEKTDYEILVKGHLDQHWSSRFPGFTLSPAFDRDNKPVTRICGPVADQAELHGILANLRDICVSILSFSSVNTSEGGEK